MNTKDILIAAKAKIDTPAKWTKGIVMNKVQKQTLIDWVVINPEGKVIAWIKKQRNGGYVLEYKGISGRW